MKYRIIFYLFMFIVGLYQVEYMHLMPMFYGKQPPPLTEVQVILLVISLIIIVSFSILSVFAVLDNIKKRKEWETPTEK